MWRTIKVSRQNWGKVVPKTKKMDEKMIEKGDLQHNIPFVIIIIIISHFGNLWLKQKAAYGPARL